MAFISIVQLKESLDSSVLRGRHTINAGLVIATDFSGKNKEGKNRYSLRVSLSSKLAKESRLIHGDRIDILFDKESSPMRGLITRVKGNGWTLVKAGESKNSRLVTKISMVDGMPTFPTAQICENVVISEEGILFDLPDECSFTENLRAKHDRH